MGVDQDVAPLRLVTESRIVRHYSCRHASPASLMRSVEVVVDMVWVHEMCGRCSLHTLPLTEDIFGETVKGG